MPTDRNDKIFIEWSHKVLDNILRSGFEERIAHVDKKIERLNSMLTGNDDPSKGILVRMDRLEQKNVEDLLLRVDRLEQSESRRTWLLRATVVACLGAIGATIASYFKK
jgi:hypothetical protein